MMRQKTKDNLNKLEKLLRYRPHDMDELEKFTGADRRTVFRWMTEISERGCVITRTSSRPTKYAAPIKLQSIKAPR